MIKLIAIDLDGTLLLSDHTVCPEAIPIMKRAVEAGIYVVVATGRNGAPAHVLQESAGLTGQPMMLHNGALIRMPDGSIRQTARMPRAYGQELMRVCNEENMTCGLAFGDCAYVVNNREDAFANALFWRFAMIDDNIVLEDPEKLDTVVPADAPEWLNKLFVVSESTERLIAMEEKLKEHFGKRLGVFKSGDNYVDLMPPDMDKGAGLRILCELLGIDISETMAIGDSENDVGMLKAAEISVAMANADHWAKAAARFETDTNDRNGVGKAIERFVFSGE